MRGCPSRASRCTPSTPKLRGCTRSSTSWRPLGPPGGLLFAGAAAATYARHHPDDVVSRTLLEPVFTFAYPPAELMVWTLLSSLPGLPDSIREKALSKVGGTEYNDSDPIAQDDRQRVRAPWGRAAPAQSSHRRRGERFHDAGVCGDRLRRFTRRRSTGCRTCANRATERDRRDLAGHTYSLPRQAAGPLETRLDEFWTTHERHPEPRRINHHRPGATSAPYAPSASPGSSNASSHGASGAVKSSWLAPLSPVSALVGDHRKRPPPSADSSHTAHGRAAHMDRACPTSPSCLDPQVRHERDAVDHQGRGGAR